MNMKNGDLMLSKPSKEIDADKDLDAAVKPLEVPRPKEAKKTLEAAKEKFGEETVTRQFQESTRELEKQGTTKIALLCGAATFGFIISGTLLTSLEVFPLVPEAMQLVGLAYSVLVVSRVIREEPEKFKVSPVRAVIEILDEGEEKTNLMLPRDLDEGTVAAMEQLVRERDIAVNQREEMRRQSLILSQVRVEKEALEVVALQLAEERERAVSEANGLKRTVESISERMKGVEGILEIEVDQLKKQKQILETVAGQLAQERNVAIEEVDKLKARSEAEKRALEEVAMQLAKERDDALAEIESVRNILANMQSISASE
ncbi:uncharacterized protein [Physcomitrium patens]|nr:uncharacterized protein LOC112288216 isoform X2 [Physcomitrium patens]XP_024387961.1 uncharacterized protein LOC112288216 isoform X2 [Physcomitrium patens]|eukprot:XP_024387960.1 uncharacterized protein LOC112288216 isoform X2 [Physcomitrella patens]